MRTFRKQTGCVHCEIVTLVAFFSLADCDPLGPSAAGGGRTEAELRVTTFIILLFYLKAGSGQLVDDSGNLVFYRVRRLGLITDIANRSGDAEGIAQIGFDRFIVSICRFVNQHLQALDIQSCGIGIIHLFAKARRIHDKLENEFPLFEIGLRCIKVGFAIG